MTHEYLLIQLLRDVKDMRFKQSAYFAADKFGRGVMFREVKASESQVDSTIRTIDSVIKNKQATPPDENKGE